MSTIEQNKTYISSTKQSCDSCHDQGKPITEQISEGLSNAAAATKDTFSAAADSVASGFNSAKESVFGKAEDARESANIAAEKVNAKADEGVQKFKEEKGNRSQSERLADKTENFADKAAKGIQRMGEKAADTVEKIGRGDKMREKERQKDFEKNVVRHDDDRFTRAEMERREENKGFMEKCGEKIEEFGERIQGQAR